MFSLSSTEDFVLVTLLTLCLLLFAAKIGGELARRFGIAAVVGELFAGIILAPTLLGGLHVMGMQLIVVNDEVKMFAELGAILLLFLVGLETRFADFTKSGLLATIVACGGVIVPFVLGYALVIAWGYPYKEALLVGAALTATSIAITVKVLKDIGRFQTKESGILIGAAVIDDVLGLIVLAIVLGLVEGGELNLIDIGIVTVQSVGVWLALTIVGVFGIAKLIDRLCPRKECPRMSGIQGELYGPNSPGIHCILKCDGTQEASAIALCFSYAYVAGLAGLAPILGAFAAGMTIAETKILATIQDVTEKINFLMAPLFFVVIGTYVDLSGLTVDSLIFASILIALAMVGKIIGCGLPLYVMNRDPARAIIVGLGMMSRGEVGLIIAGIGATSGIFSNEVFSAVVLMVVVTTVVTPIALSQAYKRLKFTTPVTLPCISDEECARSP
ncbi:cation:proton antiporter [Methanocella paludicola]|uniref:cation:proton antiporter n=1 Tax=Methanocella paludicola TaxID=570267 RepID=UPI00373AE9E4